MPAAEHLQGQLFNKGPVDGPKPTASGQGRLFHTPDTARTSDPVGQPTVNPHQLQAFMTPREIHARYQGLDGDLEDGSNERQGEYTGRSQDTYGRSNERIETGNRAYYQRPASQRGWGDMKTSDTHTVGYHQENHEEMWQRKLSESQYDADYYADERGDERPEPSSSYLHDSMSSSLARGAPPGAGTSTWDAHQERVDSHVNARHEQFQDSQDNADSMYDSIRAGGIRNPIHLGNQFGSLGKPQIVGGHHRLAAQTDINPDTPIPVLHHNSIQGARSTPGYKYT